jgi:DNA-binding PadR family transcriptional regulator
MNLTRLVIMGLLAERGPRHGHQLRRDAELAEADRWAGIAVRSLHRELRGLESEGLIGAVRTERVGRRPERTVYGLTDEGRRELSVLRQQAVSQLDAGPDPLSVVLVFAGTDDPAELAALLARRQQPCGRAAELAVGGRGRGQGTCSRRSRRCRPRRSASRDPHRCRTRLARGVRRALGAASPPAKVGPPAEKALAIPEAEPAERLPARPPRLGALACPPFARLLSGQVVSQVGTQMNNTAEAWVLYRLTHSAQVLGLQGLCFSLPIAVLPLFTGVLADRFSRLALVKATLAAEAAQAFGLAALAGTGNLRPWMLYLAAGTDACRLAVGIPAQSALIPNVVPPTALLSALALSSSTWSSSAMVVRPWPGRC